MPYTCTRSPSWKSLRTSRAGILRGLSPEKFKIFEKHPNPGLGDTKYLKQSVPTYFGRLYDPNQAKSEFLTNLVFSFFLQTHFPKIRGSKSSRRFPFLGERASLGDRSDHCFPTFWIKKCFCFCKKTDFLFIFASESYSIFKWVIIKLISLSKCGEKLEESFTKMQE